MVCPEVLHVLDFSCWGPLASLPSPQLSQPSLEVLKGVSSLQGALCFSQSSQGMDGSPSTGATPRLLPVQSWPRQAPTAAFLSCLVAGIPQQRWDPCFSLHMVLVLGLLVWPLRGDLPLSQPLGKAGAGRKGGGHTPRTLPGLLSAEGGWLSSSPFDALNSQESVTGIVSALEKGTWRQVTCLADC